MPDPNHLKRVAEWKADDILFCIARIPQTGRLLIGGSDFKVYEFDAAAEKPERIPFAGEGHRSYVTGLALIGETLVSGGYDGRLIWWNVTDREQIREIGIDEQGDGHRRVLVAEVAHGDGLLEPVADEASAHHQHGAVGDAGPRGFAQDEPPFEGFRGEHRQVFGRLPVQS